MLDVLTATDAAFVAPETTIMRERVVVAPCSGRFRPLPSETFSTEGEWVEPGAVLAEIDNNGATTPVRSLPAAQCTSTAPLAEPMTRIAERMRASGRIRSRKASL